MRLDTFRSTDFERGASRLIEVLWLVVCSMLFSTSIPGSKWRSILLRMFHARIGNGVVIKPRVRVKFPWRLDVGNHCWIGEGVWIDNLGLVKIGNHVCISQGAYLCTGSHDWSMPQFPLIVKPIIIHDHAWLCAFSRVAPGVVVGEGAVLGFGSMGAQALKPWTVYCGFPGKPVANRIMKT